jgi:Uma2 family endonuclease
MDAILTPSITLTPFRWTRARYDRLADTGILADTHCELLDGQIVELEVTISPRHAHTVEAIGNRLRLCYGLACVRTQQPVALSDDDEPEPDIMVLPIEDVGSRTAHPRTALLLIEVADTSLRADRMLKRERYARTGVPHYWIVNLVDDQVELFTAPDAATGTYRMLRIIRGPESVSLPPPGGLITADELLA